VTDTGGLLHASSWRGRAARRMFAEAVPAATSEAAGTRWIQTHSQFSAAVDSALTRRFPCEQRSIGHELGTLTGE
jgi:hypothetical protein